jgi:hypothetical protein
VDLWGKQLSTEAACDPTVLLLLYADENRVHAKTCTQVFVTIIRNNKKVEITQVFTSG